MVLWRRELTEFRQQGDVTAGPRSASRNDALVASAIAPVLISPNNANALKLTAIWAHFAIAANNQPSLVAKGAWTAVMGAHCCPRFEDATVAGRQLSIKLQS